VALRENVILLTRDPATTAAVTAAVASNGRFELAGTHEALSAVIEQLTYASASAVLVDVDLDPTGIFRDLNAVIQRFPDTRFLVLSSTFRREFVFEAMQVGARHYLIKDSIEADLLGVLHRLVPDRGAEVGQQGCSVTVLAASGGCGATTFAVNLANELGTSEAPALVIDLDCFHGAVASYLGVEGRYGIADVLSRDGHIDGHLISSTSIAYSKSLHVLLSPASIDFVNPKPPRFEVLKDVLEACTSAYAYTVIDAPRVPIRVQSLLARTTATTFIVFQLTVKDINMAAATRQALIAGGAAEDRIVCVANRYRKRSPVSLNDARKALGDATVRLVRNDFHSAVRSLNDGRLLAESAASSRLRRDICDLAQVVRAARGPSTTRT
jgi:pilus assembly protein CpaE